MLKRLFSALLVGSPAVLLACSAGDSESATNGESAVRSGPGDEGASCGGFAGLECKPGLECRLSADHPDAMGRCVRARDASADAEQSKPKAGEEGGECGGFEGIECSPGLRCRHLGNASDSAGVCERPEPGTEGGECGGFEGIECDPGLRCRRLSEAFDAAGVCERSRR